MNKELLLLKALYGAQSLIHILDEIENLPNHFNKVKNASKNYSITLERELLKHLNQIYSIEIETSDTILRSFDNIIESIKVSSIEEIIQQYTSHQTKEI